MLLLLLLLLLLFTLREFEGAHIKLAACFAVGREFETDDPVDADGTPDCLDMDVADGVEE